MSRQPSRDNSEGGRGKRARVHAVGRPPKEGELATIRKDILFTPSEWAEIGAMLGDVGAREISPKLRELLLGWARGEMVEGEALRNELQSNFEVKLAQLGTDAFRAPILSSVPCGPWSAAVAEAETFAVSLDVARELEAQRGDVWVRASGDSMTEAGITDGVLVLSRPLGERPPRRGDVVIAQIERAGGEIEGTMKQYDGTDGQGRDRLVDGAGQTFTLPEDTVRVWYPARAQGKLGLI